SKVAFHLVSCSVSCTWPFRNDFLPRFLVAVNKCKCHTAKGGPLRMDGQYKLILIQSRLKKRKKVRKKKRGLTKSIPTMSCVLFALFDPSSSPGLPLYVGTWGALFIGGPGATGIRSCTVCPGCP